MKMGLSQEDFANHAEIARSYMSRVERGKAEPKFSVIQKLSTALGVEPKTLFEPPSEAVKRPSSKPIPNVPFAKDGTCFNPSLRQAQTGEFAVGSKTDRRKFKGFYEALHYLETMHPAEWVRPTASGKGSGVVVAVDWKPLPKQYLKALRSEKS
mgnify:FL=1|jgi:transcriptional regulator with XRE-family HTH domain